jgi:hypothetical protein
MVNGKRTMIYKTPHRKVQVETGVALGRSGRIRSSCSTSDIRRVTLIKIL